MATLSELLQEQQETDAARMRGEIAADNWHLNGCHLFLVSPNGETIYSGMGVLESALVPEGESIPPDFVDPINHRLDDWELFTGSLTTEAVYSGILEMIPDEKTEKAMTATWSALMQGYNAVRSWLSESDQLSITTKLEVISQISSPVERMRALASGDRNYTNLALFIQAQLIEAQRCPNDQINDHLELWTQFTEACKEGKYWFQLSQRAEEAQYLRSITLSDPRIPFRRQHGVIPVSRPEELRALVVMDRKLRRNIVYSGPVDDATEQDLEILRAEVDKDGQPRNFVLVPEERIRGPEEYKRIILQSL